MIDGPLAGQEFPMIGHINSQIFWLTDNEEENYRYTTRMSEGFGELHYDPWPDNRQGRKMAAKELESAATRRQMFATRRKSWKTPAVAAKLKRGGDNDGRGQGE